MRDYEKSEFIGKSVHTGSEQEEAEGRRAIRKELDQLGKMVEVLDTELHGTMDTFTPVLLPSQDDGQVKGEPDQVRPVTSPMAEELRSYRKRLQRMQHYLMEVKERNNL